MFALFGFLDFLGPSELIIVAIVAILLYGERLPEVARSFGKNFVELKKSVRGVREEFEAATREVTSSVTEVVTRQDVVDREEATAPKFEPPLAESESEAQGGAVDREETTAPKFEPPPTEPVAYGKGV